MSELNHMTAPALLQVENLRVSFKNEEKQYIETATVRIPISLQERITRTAISPRLAIRTFCIIIFLFLPEMSHKITDAFIIHEHILHGWHLSLVLII